MSNLQPSTCNLQPQWRMAFSFWNTPVGIAHTTDSTPARPSAHAANAQRSIQIHPIQGRAIEIRFRRVTLGQSPKFMIPPKDLRKTKIKGSEALSFPNSWAPILVLAAVLISQLCGFAGSSSEFEVVFAQNLIRSLKPRREGAAEYVQSGQRLGEIIARWREAGQQEWHLFTN